VVPGGVAQVRDQLAVGLPTEADPVHEAWRRRAGSTDGHFARFHGVRWENPLRRG
jgi:hypothetical protein